MFNLKEDIEKALKKYLTLEYFENGGKLLVRGQFTARNKKIGVEIETYEVLIRFPEEYPYLFPKVIEISEKIPKEMDRHVKPDETLCFCVPQEEWILCANGITLTWFLDEVLNAHLCKEFVREKTGNYPTGERSHGKDGIWEYYYEVFETTEKEIVLYQLELILSHLPIGRNAPCYCNSGKIFKACHEKVENRTLSIGKNKLKLILDYLKKDSQ